MHKTSAWSSTSIINFQKKAINWSEDQSREWLKKIDTLQNNNLSTRDLNVQLVTVERSSIKTCCKSRTHHMDACWRTQQESSNAWWTDSGCPPEDMIASKFTTTGTCQVVSTCAHTCDRKRHSATACGLYEVKSVDLGSFDVECHQWCLRLWHATLASRLQRADAHVETKFCVREETFCIEQSWRKLDM